jgi:ssDNA-binding Zn-finger/Zn-ribbon topoisomerase 1
MRRTTTQRSRTADGGSSAPGPAPTRPPAQSGARTPSHASRSGAIIGVMRRERSGNRRPIGRLQSGEPYYAPIGQMRCDGDRVQCHLRGRWLRMVGGCHLIVAHGITTAEYRELFRLFATVSTVAPETAERKRASMLEQFATGQRERSPATPPALPTVGKWRSLAVLHPRLLGEWHPTRNDGLDPYRTGQYSHRKVWWRCGQCGHEWQTSPHERTFAGRGCPACGRRRSIAAIVERNRSFRPPRVRSFAAQRPDLLMEWHSTRNGDLDPYAIAAGSERKVWWRCGTPACGHEWQAVVADRRKGEPGCPGCVYRRAGERRALASRDRSLAALHPQLLDEWHPTRNGDIDPCTIKPGSERRLWWRCSYCGHDWQAPPMSRRHSPRGGCPTCAIRLARGVKLARSASPPAARTDPRRGR